MRKKITAYQFITLAIAILLGMSAFTLSYTDVLHEPDEFISNYIYTYNPLERADNRITIVAIDSESEEEYGEYSSWSRSLLADAVNVLSKENACVIALDTDLSEAKDDAGDSALVDACNTHGSVISMAYADFDTKKTSEKPDSENLPSNMNLARPADASMNWNDHSVIKITYPFDALKNVTTTGITNAVQQGSDNSIRSAALDVKIGASNREESFATVTYKLFKDNKGEEYNFPEVDNQNLFEFHNIYNTNSYQVISFSNLLNGNYDKSYIDGRIVLIGEYQAVDRKNKPLDFGYLKSDSAKQEVLIESAIIQALLTNKIIQTVDKNIQALMFCILIIALYIVCARRRTISSILAYIFTLMIFITFSYFMYLQGYRILLLVPSLFAISSFIINLLQKLIRSYIEQYKIKRTLNLYVDSQVVDKITDTNPFELTRLSERRNIAVLFVDIRGFTTLSESLDPEQVVDILNEYFTVVYSSIEAWNGTLDKFIGDAAMAIFNAPSDLEDFEFKAVCAADDIVKEFEDIRYHLKEKYDKDVNIGIGINCGEAIVGNIGCLGRMDYTAIGDVVNTASRLESKAAPGQILISDNLYNKLKERFEASSIGALELKGKAKAVDTYQVDKIEKPEAPNARGRKEFLRENTLLHTKIRPTLELH